MFTFQVRKYARLVAISLCPLPSLLVLVCVHRKETWKETWEKKLIFSLLLQYSPLYANHLNKTATKLHLNLRVL